MNWAYINISLGSLLIILGIALLSIHPKNPLTGDLIISFTLILGGILFILTNIFLRDTDPLISTNKPNSFFYISLSIFSAVVLFVFSVVAVSVEFKLLERFY